MPPFESLLRAQWGRKHFVCLGLRGEYHRLPKSMKFPDTCKARVHFNCGIVQETKDVVCAYHLYLPSYDDDEGCNALRKTIVRLEMEAPRVPIFLERASKHEGLGFFHRDRPIMQLVPRDEETEIFMLASNPMPAPDEIRELRRNIGDMPMLIRVKNGGPNFEELVPAAQDEDGQGMLFLTEEAVFASPGMDFAQATRNEIVKLNHHITQYRKENNHAVAANH